MKKQQIERRGPKMTKNPKFWYFFTHLLIYAYILQWKTLKNIDLFMDSHRA